MKIKIFFILQTYQIDANGERHPTYYNEISVSIAAGILIAAIQVILPFNKKK